MTALQTYWLVDEAGNKALATGANERDRFLPLGWAESTEPAGEEFVWMRHADVANPARFPAASVPVWMVKGWEPGTPPHPFADLEPDTAAAPPVTAADTKPKPAAGGTSSKEN